MSSSVIYLLVLVAGPLRGRSSCGGTEPHAHRVQAPPLASLRGGGQDASVAAGRPEERLHSVLARRAALLDGQPAKPAAPGPTSERGQVCGARELQDDSVDTGYRQRSASAGPPDYVKPTVPEHTTTMCGLAVERFDEKEDGARRQACPPVREGGGGIDRGKRQARTWEECLEDILGPSSEEERAERLATARKALGVSVVSVYGCMRARVWI